MNAPFARPSRRTLAWALPALAFVLSSGVLGLVEPTETRYAEIGREMAVSGDWLTPRLNGISHFHKPPLSYWMIAGGIKLLGANEWGARFGAALAGAFLLWCVSRIARRVRGDGSHEIVLAPIVLASAALAFALAHQLGSDIFLAATVAGWWAAFLDPDRRGGVLPWIALGAGFMVKGPVVLVHTIVPVLVAALWTRDRAALRPLGAWRGILLFLVLSLAWYAIEAIRVPGLAHYWLANQIWGRYATTVHHRPGPWYYFIAVVLVGMLPWTVPAVAGAWRECRQTARERDFPSAAVLVWALLPIVFFSTSHSKLPAYVLPEMPALALLATAALCGAGRARIWRVSAGLFLVAIAIALEVIGPGALARLVGASFTKMLPLPAAAHVAVFSFGAAGALLLLGRAVAGAAAALAAWLVLLIAAHSVEGAIGSPRQLAMLMRRARIGPEPVVEYQTFNAGIPFYLGEIVPMVDVPRELDFDTPDERSKAMLTDSEVRQLVEGHGRTWIYCPEGRTAGLASRLDLPMSPVARWRRYEVAVLIPKE